MTRTRSRTDKDQTTAGQFASTSGGPGASGTGPHNYSRGEFSPKNKEMKFFMRKVFVKKMSPLCT